MQRFTDYWVSISKAKKVTIGLVILILALSLTLAYISRTRNSQNAPAKPVPEKWERLNLNSAYSPLYIVSPKTDRKFGIVSQEVFSLKTKEPVDQSFVKNNLISSKAVIITQKSTTDFEITPTKPLAIEETIVMSMKDNSDYSWIFQTAPKFKVTDTLPRDKATNVPVNAGVEFTFNNDSYELQNSDITLNPAVSFRLEKHDQKTALVPLTPLKPKTLYTVILKKNISLFSGNNSLDRDYSFSFQTGDIESSKARLALAKDFQEVFPDEPLVTKVYAGDFGNQTISTKVFKFASLDDFISSRSNLDKTKATWTSYFGEEDPVNTNNMAVVLTADLKIQAQGENQQLQYLQLPQNLDEGFYLVQFRFDGGNKLEQLWVQSSSIPGYISVGKLQTAIWINSAKGEELGSSAIRILGSNDTYSTNELGWAAFPTPNIFFDTNGRHYIVVTTGAGRKLVIPVDNLSRNAKPDEIVADDYWSYLYQERLLYKPNDTVNFWGVAKNKDTGSPPGDIDIYIDDVLSQTVHPESDGSYIGKVQLTNYNLGYSTVTAKIKEVTLNSSYFQVSDYVKPELKIEVSPNKQIIFAGDSVNYKARVLFFDGTPATNMKLFISSSYSGEVDKTEIVADKNGEAGFTYKSKVDSVNSYPRYEGVTVSADKSGDGPSDGASSVYVYGSQLEIDSTSTQNQEHASFKATVKTLDLDLVNNQGLNSPINGVAKNQKVALNLTKTWWEQKQVGTYYDFIEKVTRPSYNSIRHDENVDNKDLYTDANGQINYSFTMEKDKSYQAVLTATDSVGRPTVSTSYFYYSDYRSSQDQGAKAYMNMNRDTNSFSINDEVDIKIEKKGAGYVTTDKSKFLFILAERGAQEVIETSAPELKFNFANKYLPEVYVGSLIFNGRSYEEVTSSCKSGWICSGYDYYNNDYFFDPLLIRYQNADSKLDLSITKDKVKYLPGDIAHISVKVTKNGSPVSEATVQLTLVDEALAAIGGVRAPSISELYKQSANLIYYNYYSHRPVLPDNPQAERGGGGGGRDLFKDTAYFDTAKSDDNGVAVFDVSLPDNITNWLTYAQSVTSSVDYGQTETSTVTTKEFFVTSQFPHIVTVRDMPVIAVGTFGTGVTADAKIPLTLTVAKDDKDIAKSAITVKPFSEDYITFPRVAAGDYKVAVGGSYKNLSDGLTLPISVINGRLDFKLVKEIILNAGANLKSFDGVNLDPTHTSKLIVTDAGKGKYYYDLLRYCYQTSNRVEKRIATLKASQILVDRFKEADCNADQSDLQNFQSSDGGLRQVQWGGSDLETTLWATYIDPAPFNRDELIRYFETANAYGSTNDITEGNILKNWGLTLLGKPNINELNRLARSATTFRGKVLAGLALYSAGNKEKSKEMYFNILSNYVYTNKPYLRVEADPAKRDYDKFALDTSYALLLGTLNFKDYNSGLDLYLKDYGNQVSTVVLDIADISYLDTLLADLPNIDSVINFKTNLKSVSQNISQEGPLTMNLSPNELSNFNLKVESGKVDAILHYSVNSSDFAKLKDDDRISIERNVTKVKGDLGTLKIGDILRIDLSYNFDEKAPLGCYSLTDYIPSGMTYLENYSNFGLSIGQNGYMYPVGNNTVTGCAYNSRWWNSYTGNRSVYFVRITGAGKFVQEPTIMQSVLDPSIFQKTQEDYVKIGQ